MVRVLHEIEGIQEFNKGLLTTFWSEWKEANEEWGWEKEERTELLEKEAGAVATGGS